MSHPDDERLMRLALDHALAARTRGDTPVAAVIARGGTVLAVGENAIRSAGDCTAHAEVSAIRRAEAAHGAGVLAGASCYTTMEPCPMCAWALVEAGITRIVLGARHRQLGRKAYGSYALEGLYAMTGHPMEIVDGVLSEECGAMRLAWMRSVGRET
ncbi:MAG: nucleoside deaminase [Alkalilacustris sp.]